MALDMRMFTKADAASAAILRKKFGGMVLGDWRKILAFADGKSILPSEHTRLLIDALDEVSAADVSVRSELVFFYFLALDRLHHDNQIGATTAITSLGNALLDYAAEGVVSGSLPVTQAVGGGVDLPAAAPGSAFPVAPVQGVLDNSIIQVNAREIKKLTAATWLVEPRPQDRPGIRGATAPIEFEIRKYDEQTSAYAGIPCHLRVLQGDSEKGRSVLVGLEHAFDLIQTTDPELASEIAVLTEYVVPMEGLQFIGGSDIFMYGATFLCLKPEWSALCFADHIIHEAAHQLIHAVQELEPLILNGDQVGQPSPIRSDPRPLYGSFHATFVFLRLASFMLKVFESGEGDVAREAEIRLHRHLLGLLQGLNILVEYGQFSESGKRYLESWINAAKELTASVGMPNSQLYELLTWDYQQANSKLPMLTV